MTTWDNLMRSIAADIDRNARHYGQPRATVCSKCNGPVHDAYRIINGRGVTVTIDPGDTLTPCDACGCIRLIKEQTE